MGRPSCLINCWPEHDLHRPVPGSRALQRKRVYRTYTKQMMQSSTSTPFQLRTPSSHFNFKPPTALQVPPQPGIVTLMGYSLRLFPGRHPFPMVLAVFLTVFRSRITLKTFSNNYSTAQQIAAPSFDKQAGREIEHVITQLLPTSCV